MDLNPQSHGNDAGNTPKPAEVQGTAASIVHDVLEQAENATGQAADKVQPVVAKMPHAAQAPLYEAVHAAADAAASTRESADDALRGSAGDYVRANPLQSVGIALAAGWLIGRILL